MLEGPGSIARQLWTYYQPLALYVEIPLYIKVRSEIMPIASAPWKTKQYIAKSADRRFIRLSI
jgi:hypothetical protein